MTSSDLSAESPPNSLSHCPSCPSSPVTETTEPDVALSDVSLDVLVSARRQYVLVTGGLGFIGSHTSAELLKAGYNVIIVDDLRNSYREVLDRILEIAHRHFGSMELEKCPIIELHPISYQDLPAMRAVLEMHSLSGSQDEPRRSDIVGVIHFAADKSVEESIRQPLKYYQNNINGLVDFMGLLDEFSLKTFIFSSSAAVYGTLADSGTPVHESNRIHPAEGDVSELPQSNCTHIKSPYGRTKYFAEAILSDIAESDPSWNIAILRYFNPVGCDPSGLLMEDPRGAPSNLLPVLTQVVTGFRDELKVFGGDWNTPDGTAIRDFIHVSDLARGHMAALSACKQHRLRRSYRTYNLGTGRGHSIFEVLHAMESALGHKIPWKMVDRRPGDVQSSVAAVERAKHELGWETKLSLQEACRDICNGLAQREL